MAKEKKVDNIKSINKTIEMTQEPKKPIEEFTKKKEKYIVLTNVLRNGKKYVTGSEIEYFNGIEKLIENRAIKIEK